jgi:hypothetical protein
MARNPIYDILEEKAPAPAGAAQPTERNPIYDILPVKPIEIPKGVMRFGGRSGSEERFRMLNPQVQQQLVDAAIEYNAQTGRKLDVNSSFRTPEDQQRLYDESIAAGREGKTASGYPIAKPGTSKHQRGIVVDVQQGKDDPIAQQILANRGFAQTVAGDPVHFEYVQNKPIAAPAANMPIQPAPAVVQPTQPTPPTQPPASREDQTLAGLSGFARGATAGLIQYPQALVLRATRAVTGGAPTTFSEALQDVRQSQGQLQEQYPTTYGVGEIGGTIAGLGKAAKVVGLGANPVQRVAGLAGIQAATSKATESPATTAAQAVESGGVATAGALALGGAGKAVEVGLSKVGQKSVSSTIEKMIDTHVPGTRSELEKAFGPAYRAALKKAESSKPTLQTVRDEFKEAGVRPYAEKVTQRLREKTAEWEASNTNVKDITTWAARRAENPSLVQRYSQQEAPTGYGGDVKSAADRLSTLSRAAVGQQATVTGLTALTGAAGVGALGGAAYGYFSGGDPLTGAITGGGSLPLALAAGRFGGTRQFLNPTQIGSMGGSVAGSQIGMQSAEELQSRGYRLSDLFNRKPE